VADTDDYELIQRKVRESICTILPRIKVLDDIPLQVEVKKQIDVDGGMCLILASSTQAVDSSPPKQARPSTSYSRTKQPASAIKRSLLERPATSFARRHPVPIIVEDVAISPAPPKEPAPPQVTRIVLPKNPHRRRVTAHEPEKHNPLAVQSDSTHSFKLPSIIQGAIVAAPRKELITARPSAVVILRRARIKKQPTDLIELSARASEKLVGTIGRSSLSH
jgi:hypothetical protein